jgi:tetratricopeptide (TPR) repeat protein
LQEKRPDEAFVHCTKALELNPGFIDARYNLGTVFVAMGKNAEARAEFLKVLAINPNFTPAKNALDQLTKNP